MARRDSSLWHTLGRTVETLTHPRPRKRTRKGGKGRISLVDPLAGLAAGAATTLLTSTVTGWAKRRRPSLGRMARGALAGAGAAAVLFAFRRLTDSRESGVGDSTREIVDELLAGAGRGVLYAALLDPYLPGPPAVRGALAGTADFLAAPLGGLFSRLQPLSPIRRVPVVSVLLETGDADPDPYTAFLLHGIVLGIFHGNPADRG